MAGVFPYTAFLDTMLTDRQQEIFDFICEQQRRRGFMPSIAEMQEHFGFASATAVVADVHQPLHTVAGYFDCTDPTDPKLISDPALAQKLPHDRGGNQLFYTKTLELHALWDTKLVSKLAHAKTPAPLAALLTKEVSITKFTTPGDYHTWPAKWVSDSATEAIAAYKGLEFGPASLKADGKINRIEILPPTDYDELHLPRVKTQLGKSCVHLAQLLSSVRFK